MNLLSKLNEEKYVNNLKNKYHREQRFILNKKQEYVIYHPCHFNLIF